VAEQRPAVLAPAGHGGDCQLGRPSRRQVGLDDAGLGQGRGLGREAAAGTGRHHGPRQVPGDREGRPEVDGVPPRPRVGHEHVDERQAALLRRSRVAPPQRLAGEGAVEGGGGGRLVADGHGHRRPGDGQCRVHQRRSGRDRRGPGLGQVAGGPVGVAVMGQRDGARGGGEGGEVAVPGGRHRLDHPREGGPGLGPPPEEPQRLDAGALGQRQVERTAEPERGLGRVERALGVAQVHQRDRPEPRDRSPPRVVEGAGRDAVELGQHARAVVLDVDDDGPCQAGERGGLGTAAGLEREQPLGHGHQALDVLGPPGEHPELHQAGQLTLVVARLPERGRRSLQAGTGGLGVGVAGGDGGQELAARVGADRRGEAPQPVGQDVVGHRRVDGAEGVDDRRGQLAVSLAGGAARVGLRAAAGPGVEEQPHRGRRVAPPAHERGGAPAQPGHVGGGHVAGQQGAPQGMERPLPAGDGGDERQAGDQVVDVARPDLEHPGGEVVVEGAEVGKQPEGAAAGRRQAGEHLLAHVGGGHAGGGAGRELGHGGPPAAAGDLGGGHVPERGEVAHLVVAEGELVVVQPGDAAGDLQSGEPHGRWSPAAHHHVPVRRQGGDHCGEQPGPVRARGDLVHVVDDQRHLLGRPPPQGLGHRGGRALDARGARSGGDRGADGGAQPEPERGGGVVARLAGEPAVDPERGGGVGRHGLGQQGGLAVARGGGHDGDRHVPAAPQAGQEPLAHQHAAPGAGRFQPGGMGHAGTLERSHRPPSPAPSQARLASANWRRVASMP
jgi:hypothetical protein